jgi:hypothetical protein
MDCLAAPVGEDVFSGCKFDTDVPYRRLSNKGEFCENRRSDRHILRMGVNEFTLVISTFFDTTG